MLHGVLLGDLEGRMWFLTVFKFHGGKSKLSSVAAGVETTFLLMPTITKFIVYNSENKGTTVSLVSGENNVFCTVE